MTEEPPCTDDTNEPVKQKRKGGEVRPLTTDERASFVILALYMVTFCICTFVYWDSLMLKILGVTAASGGLFLFAASFFNTEAPERSNSIHPLRSYLFSLVTALLVLFTLRFIGGLITHFVMAVMILYGGLLVALVVFRKALIQVISTLLVVVFLFVTISNHQAILVGNMKFQDAIRQCGQVVFRIGPIQDVANLLIAGNYMSYLSLIDYRDDQINILASRTVATANDNEVKKVEAILNFVSNEIYYISDPGDGMEYAKKPITTLLAGGGDCEDQTLLLCSMLETVGVKTYIAFTDEHVFALVPFSQKNPSLGFEPHLLVDGTPCYALDSADPGARIGYCSSRPESVKRVFDVRRKTPVGFSPAQ